MNTNIMNTLESHVELVIASEDRLSVLTDVFCSLQAIRFLLDDFDNWTINEASRDACGRSIDIGNDAACSWCMLGARWEVELQLKQLAARADMNEYSNVHIYLNDVDSMVQDFIVESLQECFPEYCTSSIPFFNDMEWTRKHHEEVLTVLDSAVNYAASVLEENEKYYAKQKTETTDQLAG